MTIFQDYKIIRYQDLGYPEWKENLDSSDASQCNLGTAKYKRTIKNIPYKQLKKNRIYE